MGNDMHRDVCWLQEKEDIKPDDIIYNFLIKVNGSIAEAGTSAREYRRPFDYRHHSSL